ncbi:MAG TPA: trypsin-like peptidase domain-containing protein [Mycobacteriales bacterium]
MTHPPEDPGPRPPWGYPDDAGQPPYYSPWAAPYPPAYDGSRLPSEQPVRSSRLVAAIAVGIVSAAVIGGGVGALAGHREASRSAVAPSVADLTIPQAVLPVTGPTLPPAQAPGSVAAIAAAVVPSVVTINVRNDVEQATGSGVVLRADGYIVTNNHVVAPALSDGGRLTVDLSATDTGIPAQIVGRSPSDDLAVIKIARTGLRAARLGHSSSLQVGDEVVAIGAPLGLSGSVSEGIVSALNRNVDVPEEGSTQKATVLGNAIQTDAAINPGNSGGALVDAGGRLIGISVEFLADRARALQAPNELAIAPDLAERKATLLMRSDAVVVMVGGSGTLDEATDVLELRKHGLYSKPVVVLNTDGFYDGLKQQFVRMDEEGFLPIPVDQFCTFVDQPADALAVIEQAGV